MKSYLSSILIFSLAHSLSAQTRHYVNWAAAGANDGSSWADAFTGLQPALAAAHAGDEVWVAAGTYRPTLGTDRGAAFELLSGVRLYGGFAGWETDLGQRDWQANATVLSGDIGVPGDSTDNSHNVLRASALEEGTLLDGLTVCCGTAEPELLYDPFQPDGCGGGLYVNAGDGEANLLVRNCRFERNYARLYGGAVLVRASDDGLISPQFLGCSFVGNTSAADGGAVYCRGYGGTERVPDFGGCLFESNACGRWGKALAYRGPERGDTLHFWGCTFRSNKKMGTTWIGYDVVTFADNHLRYFGCLFEDSRKGATSNNCIGTEYFNPNTGYARSCYIDSCDFARNVAIAILSLSYDTRIGRCMFWENFGIMIDDGSPKLSISRLNIFSNKSGYFLSTSNSILPNTSSKSVSDLLIAYNKPQGVNTPNYLFASSKGVTFQNFLLIENDSLNSDIFLSAQLPSNDVDSFLIRHIHFIDNKFVAKPLSNKLPPLRISNSVFWGNKLGLTQFLASNHKAVLEHCAFDSLDCAALLPNVTCGPGNLSGVDPLFRDPANGDYTLLPCSPLIDAGSDAAAAGIPTDIAGKPRIQGARVDIGAHEAPPFALAAPPAVKSACGTASDGAVSIALQDGCGPLSFSWDPSAGNGPELTGLPPGAYAYTATDAAGRSVTGTASVPAAPEPELALAASDVACGAIAGGSLMATVAGGTAPFAYAWEPALGGLPQHSGLPAGAYLLTVTDANGCSGTASATLSLLGALTLSVGGTPIACHGNADAALLAEPLNGLAPFSWHWDGWPGTGPEASPLGPGQYSVTVTDALGCTSSFAFNPVTDPPPLSAVAEGLPQTQPSPPNGAAAVTSVSGGSPWPPPAQPYAYGWSEGSAQPAVGGLAAGTYTVTVTDSRGCTAVAEVTVGLMLSTGGGGQPAAFALWPCPAADWLAVALPPGDWEIRLLDAGGRAVATGRCAGGGAACPLDLRGLPSGTYVLEAWDGNGRRGGQKVVKK